MEAVLNAGLVVLIAVVAVAFGNWIGMLAFGVVRALGARIGFGLGRVDRLGALGMLNLLGPWAWIANNVFIFALIGTVTSSILGWGLAGGASALSWLAFFAALLMYGLAGLGDGVNRVQRTRILTRAGFAPLEIALLDKPLDQLDDDERAVVVRQQRAVADHFNLHPSYRSDIAAHEEAGVSSSLSVAERRNIIADFGEVLEANADLLWGAPESMLPHPRARIEQALCEEILAAAEDRDVDSLEAGFVQLASFLPDPDGSIGLGIARATKQPLPTDASDIVKWLDDPDRQTAMEQANRLLELVARRSEEAMDEVRRLREIRARLV